MDKEKPLKRRLMALALLFFSGTILKTTYLFASRIWRVDLYYYIDAAKTMLEGGILYKDFGCSHPPLGYFEYYMLARLFGYENMYVSIKGSLLVIQTLMAFIIYLSFVRLYNWKKALLNAHIFLVLISLSITLWPHNIPFTFMLPVLIGIWLIIKDDFNPKPASLFLFGFCISCATLISTNVIFYSLIIPFLSIKNNNFKIQYLLRDGLVALGGFLIPAIIVALYFIKHDALSDWHFWNIGWASIYAGFKPWYTNIGNFFLGFIKIWEWLPFTALAVYACYVIIKEKHYLNNKYAFFILVAVLCACMSKYPMNKPHPRYYLYMLPGLIFAIDYGISVLTDSNRKRIIIALSVYSITILSITNINAWKEPYDSQFSSRLNLKNWISQNVLEDKTIWVWDEGYEIYFETKRRKAKNSFFSAGEFLDKAKLWKANNYKNIDSILPIIPPCKNEMGGIMFL